MDVWRIEKQLTRARFTRTEHEVYGKHGWLYVECRKWHVGVNVFFRPSVDQAEAEAIFILLPIHG